MVSSTSYRSRHLSHLRPHTIDFTMYSEQRHLFMSICSEMVTCKSATPARITDNVQIFDFVLTDSQMKKLDGMECGFKVTPGPLTQEQRSRYYEDMP